MVSPAWLNASTGGAAAQQIETGGLSVEPFSLLFRFAAPRCVTQTLSCASTDPPITLPNSPSPGIGFGQNASTSNIGTSTMFCCAVAGDFSNARPAVRPRTLVVTSAPYTKL